MMGKLNHFPGSETFSESPKTLPSSVSDYYYFVCIFGLSHVWGNFFCLRVKKEAHGSLRFYRYLEATGQKNLVQTDTISIIKILIGSAGAMEIKRYLMDKKADRLNIVVARDYGQQMSTFDEVKFFSDCLNEAHRLGYNSKIYAVSSAPYLPRIEKMFYTRGVRGIIPIPIYSTLTPVIWVSELVGKFKCWFNPDAKMPMSGYTKEKSVKDSKRNVSQKRPKRCFCLLAR